MIRTPSLLGSTVVSTLAFNYDGTEHFTIVEGVDGERLKPAVLPIYLAPGKHGLAVVAVVVNRIGFYGSLHFSARPGAEYRLGAITRKGREEFRITDIARNEVVARSGGFIAVLPMYTDEDPARDAMIDDSKPR